MITLQHISYTSEWVVATTALELVSTSNDICLSIGEVYMGR